MLLSLLLQAPIVTAGITQSLSPEWDMENLVLFGDSYTDEGRLSYIQNNNALPPAGKLLPPTNNTSVGGYTWGRDVATKTGAMLYNYAVGAAMVSDNVTSHFSPNLNAPYPSILDYEIPAFAADLGYTGLYPNRTASNTVYAVWIGTNDLGIDGFLEDKQAPGTTISSFVDAILEAFDEIYKLGGRLFVALNTIPLELTPMYIAIEHGGTGNNYYWGDKAHYNTTEIESKVREFTTSANSMLETGVPFHLLVENRWPDAQFSLFDVHSLLEDVHANPQEYFTAPYVVSTSYKGCGDNGCFQSSDPLTSFMWYDEEHITPRTSEIVGDEFVKVVKNTSKYGTRY